MNAVVNLQRRPDRIAVVTLANGKVNALSSAVLESLADIAAELHSDPPAAVIITGSERFFAAGADISEFGGQAEAGPITERFHRALDAVAGLPCFVIAAVNGYALGGGCELALACDYRIAGPTAVFGQPEILLGIIPGGGGTQRLARQVGAGRAKELCLSGRQVAAEEAAAIGLVEELAEDPVARALEIASVLAAGPARAQAITKQVIDTGLSMPLADGLTAEREAFVEVFGTEDSQIGVQSFLEHGPGRAEFTGR